jgi:hypothetical protein
MNSSQVALHVPVYPPAPRAFLPLLRLIPNCIETFGARQTAALCRAISQRIFTQLADGAFDTPEAERRLLMLGITKDDIDRFAMWLLRRAGEMDCGEAH